MITEYRLNREFGDISILDSVLPSQFLEAKEYPILHEALFDPVIWASIDKSQLCFDNDGPIEHTDLKRFLGIAGQFVLNVALDGSDSRQVEAHLVQNFVNDATHRLNSHSSDFLIQTFAGAQNAHDHDAGRILEHTHFMQSAKRKGLLDIVPKKYIDDEYPDLNIDRLEFTLRQLHGMGWLDSNTFSTRYALNKLVAIEEEKLVVRDPSFGRILGIGLCYLGSEHFLNPLQRAALQNQQVQMKHRMTSSKYATVLDAYYRKTIGSGGATRAHPHDGLYGFEWETDPRYVYLEGDIDTRNIQLVSDTIQGLARTRQRVHQFQKLFGEIQANPNASHRFIHPTEEYNAMPSVPFGISVHKTAEAQPEGIMYDPRRERIIFTLPSAMKKRALDPMLSNGNRLSSIPEYASFIQDYLSFTDEDLVVEIHAVDARFGMRYMDTLKRIDEVYESALCTEQLDSEVITRALSYIGRISLDRALNGHYEQHTSYPFRVVVERDIKHENDVAI
ncbi:MAG TPA: hypothetical protein PKD20_04840, partial [Candidatus Saccharibacteria bacterium]|nr:hypothetical protein [Candidatus Saccharibacteria bacterium]